MKIRMIKKATVFLMAVTLVLATALGALAAPYYEAGVPTTSGTPTALRFLDSNYSGKRAIAFNYDLGAPYNPVKGASTPGDALIGDAIQRIGGFYTLDSIGGSVYSLTLVPAKGNTSLTLTGTDASLTATALATQINFETNTITWDPVSMGAITPGASATLLEMQTLNANGGAFRFTAFTFEQIANEVTWLTGGSGGDARYYSKLEGFAAVPEPAEWMLMIVGLGMLGFYLQRRGYLNFDFSPQSAA